MIRDIAAVMWKEWRELKNIILGSRSQKLGYLVFLGIFGIYMPLSMGKAIVEQPFMMMAFAWLPLFMVLQVVADSFAGERERHTLETLLATRLSDSAILLGKLFTVVLYGWGSAMLVSFLMLFSVNLFYRDHGLIIPPIGGLSAFLMVGLLISFFAATLGIVISMRAPTVKQAQQTMSLIVMGLWFTPFIAILILPKFISSETAKQFLTHIISKETAQHWFNSAKALGPEPFVIGIILFLLLLTGMALRYVIRRFKRSRLILSS